MISDRSKWVGGGIILGALLVVAGVSLVSQTSWGRERALTFTLGALGGQVNGDLDVARLDGNLLTGAYLYEITLLGPDGDLFVQADSAYIDYKLPTFFGGDIVIERLVVYDAEVYILKMPGDTIWNYQAIFSDTTTSKGQPRAILIDQGEFHESLVIVRGPWEPLEDGGRAREREIDVALSDTSRLLVERVDSGFVRTMRFEELDAVISRTLISSAERAGNYIQFDDISTNAYVWATPIQIDRGRGEVTLQGDLVKFRAAPVVFSESEAAVWGSVSFAGPEPRYDVHARGNEVALADLQWIYPPFPSEGTVTGDLWFETRPDGMFYEIHDLILRAPGTVVEGDAALIFGDTLRFLDANLNANPLRVETIQQMLPLEVPVEGLRIGSVEIHALDEPADPSG